MQHGDYNINNNNHPQYPPPYLQNPNPNYASAPPFSTSDFVSYNPPPPLPPYAPVPSDLLSAPVTPNPNPPPPPHSSSFSAYDFYGSYSAPPPSTQPPPPSSYFAAYHDPIQSAPSYAPPPMNITSNSGSVYSSGSSSPIGSSVPSMYDVSYDSNNAVKFDQGGVGYSDVGYGRLGGGSVDGGGGRFGYGSDLYGKRAGDDLSYGDGVYAYEGGKVEPNGARGMAPKMSTWAVFDDYGRAISFPSGKDSSSSGGGGGGSGLGGSKIVRAVPKVEVQQDVKSGVQKFRVKLLAESVGQSTIDVLCQVGLDGIRMLDPSTSRTLRIYPLETITRCEVYDPSTLAFWSKSSVDAEPRRIRLQSNSYTTNTLLDTVTAATVQFKEMGGRIRPSDASKATEQPTEKKKGLVDWMHLIKPANEEKDHWVPDEAVSKCTACGTDFSAFNRKHHCRNCGDIFCDKCTQGRTPLTAEEDVQPVRVCDRCLAEVTQRLTNAKEAANKPAGLQSHEDLAKKLQEEMERNRKASSGSKSEGSGRRIREVACPTCTVHLQVQVPSSGSETIECGVCQHPFLVSAH